MVRLSFIQSVFFAMCLGGVLTACATSLPSNFVYETSLRGEQGWPGRAQRLDSAKTLLTQSGAMDPKAALQAALPDAEVKVKRWGLEYFGDDWARYKVVLDADIKQSDDKIRCRETSAETSENAFLLDELLENDGAEFVRQMEAVVAGCVTKASAATKNAAISTVDTPSRDATNALSPRSEAPKLETESGESEAFQCIDGSFEATEALCNPLPQPALAKVCSDGRVIGWPWDCRTPEEIQTENGEAACALEDLKFDSDANICVP